MLFTFSALKRAECERGALVLLTSLAGVILLQQGGAQVGDVVCEEAAVLHSRGGEDVDAVGPVAVIRILDRETPKVALSPELSDPMFCDRVRLTLEAKGTSDFGELLTSHKSNFPQRWMQTK